MLKAMGIETWLPRIHPPECSRVDVSLQQNADASSMGDELIPSPPALPIDFTLDMPSPTENCLPENAADSIFIEPSPIQKAAVNTPSGHDDIPHEPASISYPSPEEANASPSPQLTDALWETLAAEVIGCTQCQLHTGRTQTVFGVGNRNADWLIIGEAPGEQEDLQGEPFVGRAGQLLNEMIRALGLERQQVYIANILKCRPPGNRDPSPEESAACEHYLRRQIALVRPKIILAVGRVAAQNLLKTSATIGSLRGRVHDYQQTPLVITYHPAYLLRAQLEKRKAWDDLKLALATFRSIS